MAKNLKSNHAIGCAMRQFKRFGFGEPAIATQKTTITASIFEKKKEAISGLVYINGSIDLGTREVEFNSEENIFVHVPVHRDSLSELDRDYN